MSLFLLPPHKLQRCPYSFPSVSASLDPGVNMVTECNAVGLGTKERIRELFNKVELSVSSYDTAWVAMVPSPNSSQAPCFPECINWILDNQLCDGSWGLPQHHSLLIKDLLTSTLACVLALKQWGVGEEQINKGLQFIELNSTSLTDENQHHPIGFDIIFPGMLKYANELNLNLPLEPTDLDAMLRKREVELSRGHLEGRKAYLAYVSEGMGKLQDWGMVMKYQRKNGSLFNSPSTTAAAFTHLHNADCLNYLHSVLEKFGNAVPTIYPLDIYSRLCMVDSLERLGIERHFRKEIRSVLDETYRCWLQGEEEIFMDIATCAMAFRVLRLNGYDVSSDSLSQFIKEEHDFDITRGHLKDIGAALELYRASQIIIYPDESALDKQNSWSNDFLQQKLHNGSIHVDRLNKYLIQEVDDALKFPFHANLERTANRRNIEHYNVDSTRILKTSYCSSNISNEDFLKLAVEDFNICQSIHREELKQLERCIYLSIIKGDDVGTNNFYEIFYEGNVKQWHVSHDSRELGNEFTANFTVFARVLYIWWVVENRLDQLKFARQKSAYCYFSAAATLFSPELSDARMSWAKNGVLTTVVDDFFDIGGSLEELENLIHLVEKWDVNIDTNFCSEKVQIIFSALHSTICEIGGKAFRYQGRSVTRHIIEIWLDLLGSMLREAEWVRNKSVPTIDEYMTNGYVSFALGPIVLPALYFVGPKLSEEVVSNPECHNLFKIMSTCGRLLNDIHSFKRESEEGKLNAVSLYMINNIVTEKEAIGEMKSFIDSRRRELLRLILQKRVSVVPRECKDLFWKMSEVLHLFYMKDDGFTSHEMISAVKAIIHEPISLSLCK